MLLLGIDLGTSAIKISVIDHDNKNLLGSITYPEEETKILTPQIGWAEQNPAIWWKNIKTAIKKLNSKNLYDPKDIKYIGIAYQMHGLVLLDAQDQILRNAIIWCDSRAVDIGKKAFEDLGKEEILKSHLNSPGNFTASKLKWVKENEPDIYSKIKHILWPGDFVSHCFTGEYNTTVSALSEGILWDFEKKELSDTILNYYELDKSFIPKVNKVFDSHGRIQANVAQELGLSLDVEVSYKAGDQLNNALSLNVLEPDEVAATAGTSGVIYGVSKDLIYDKASRINTFAHVNYTPSNIRTGVLLCINGTGIMNSWGRKIIGNDLSYDEINSVAMKSPLGAKGLKVLPFGNGAERMLEDKLIQAQWSNLDLNRHGKPEVFRAIQEGIVFSFRYGLDIMRNNGMNPNIIRAGHANLFLSPLFAEAFANITGTTLELCNNDGSVGAALGAGIGAGLYQSPGEAFDKLKTIRIIDPHMNVIAPLEDSYQQWLEILVKQL